MIVQKKTLKTVLCVVAVLTMLVCLFAGCGEKANDDGKDNADKTYHVGIVQLAQHPALDAATEGFQAALKDKLGDKVEFDLKNASGEETNCTTIVSKFVSDKVDLIMGNATGALVAAANATETIPVVGTSITDYATALQIKDWTGKTGFNVTGTADLAPLDGQAAMIKELFPEVKTVSVLYCSREANSKYQITVITDELKKLGFEVKEYTFVDANDLLPVVQQIVNDKAEVLYIPTDNTAAEHTDSINNVLEPAKIPVVAGEESTCKGCGIATLSINYYDIGHKAGEMAYEILVNGANPAEMEIAYAADLTKMYLASRVKTLGITIPEGYKAISEE